MKLYCKIKNNEISKPEKLSNLLINVLNAEKLSESELNAIGIYRYDNPGFDKIMQKTGDLIFDKRNNFVTRKVIDKEFDIQVEKDKKINQIQDYIKNLLRSTDVYLTRKYERGKDIPSKILNEREYIHETCDKMKEKVMRLRDVKSVLTYDYHLDNLDYHDIRVI